MTSPTTPSEPTKDDQKSQLEQLRLTEPMRKSLYNRVSISLAAGMGDAVCATVDEVFCLMKELGTMKKSLDARDAEIRGMREEVAGYLTDIATVLEASGEYRTLTRGIRNKISALSAAGE